MQQSKAGPCRTGPVGAILHRADSQYLEGGSFFPGGQPPVWGLCRQDRGKHIFSRGQHDRRVTCGLVVPNKLTLDFDQFCVVVAAQSLDGGNRHSRDRFGVTGGLVGSARQTGGEGADDGKADYVGYLSRSNGGGLVGLRAKTVEVVLNAEQAPGPSQRDRPTNVDQVVCSRIGSEAQQAADGRHRKVKGVFGPRFLHRYLRAIGKEQVDASHLQLVVEHRGLVAAKFYPGVDQTVVVHSLFFDGVGCEVAIAHCQIQTDVLS